MRTAGRPEGIGANGTTLSAKLRASGVLRLMCYVNIDDRGSPAVFVPVPESMRTLKDVLAVIQRIMKLDKRFLYARQLFLPDGELVTAISWSSDGSVNSNGFKICAARKWTQTALNTTRYVANQPLGRLRAMHEDTHEFWCDAPSAASACNGTLDAHGLCNAPVRITVNNQTWGAPVHGGFVYYQS